MGSRTGPNTSTMRPSGSSAPPPLPPPLPSPLLASFTSPCTCCVSVDGGLPDSWMQSTDPSARGGEPASACMTTMEPRMALIVATSSTGVLASRVTDNSGTGSSSGGTSFFVSGMLKAAPPSSSLPASTRFSTLDLPPAPAFTFSPTAGSLSLSFQSLLESLSSSTASAAGCCLGSVNSVSPALVASPGLPSELAIHACDVDSCTSCVLTAAAPLAPSSSLWSSSSSSSSSEPLSSSLSSSSSASSSSCCAVMSSFAAAAAAAAMSLKWLSAVGCMLASSYSQPLSLPLSSALPFEAYVCATSRSIASP